MLAKSVIHRINIAKGFNNCTARLYHNKREFYKFKLSKLNDVILRGEETTCQVQTSDVLYYSSNRLPSNDPCEDRIVVGRVPSSDMYVFSVIDGHGGYQCASAIRHRLIYYLALYLLPQAEITWRKPLNKDDWVQPIDGDNSMAWMKDQTFDVKTASSFVSRYRTRLLEMSEHSDPCHQVKAAFQNLDEDIGAEAIPEGQRITKDTVQRLLTATSGACTAAAVIDNGRVHVAGLGDCRVVLGKRNSEGGVTAHVLTEEHRTYNPVERERLIREHPHEDEDIMFFDERVCGVLQPTRAFGDVILKWSGREKMLLEYVFDETSYIPNYISPPYLISTPDVISFNISPDDVFLIIATDGLWDGLSDDLSVKLLENKPDKVNSATWLIQNSIAHGNEERLSRVLSIPPGPLCRNIRDDISVIVVYFNS